MHLYAMYTYTNNVFYNKSFHVH